jgi:hypothetical protein
MNLLGLSGVGKEMSFVVFFGKEKKKKKETEFDKNLQK